MLWFWHVRAGSNKPWAIRQCSCKRSCQYILPWVLMIISIHQAIIISIHWNAWIGVWDVLRVMSQRCVKSWGWWLGNIIICSPWTRSSMPLPSFGLCIWHYTCLVNGWVGITFSSWSIPEVCTTWHLQVGAWIQHHILINFWRCRGWRCCCTIMTWSTALSTCPFTRITWQLTRNML